MASHRRTRVVCISDTHNSTPKLPDGDVLIHAGDLTNQGSYSEVHLSAFLIGPTTYAFQLSRAVKWLENTKFEAKIVIAGIIASLTSYHRPSNIPRKSRHYTRRGILRRSRPPLPQSKYSIPRRLPLPPYFLPIHHLPQPLLRHNSPLLSLRASYPLHYLWVTLLPALRSLGLLLRLAPFSWPRLRPPQPLGRHPSIHRYCRHPHASSDSP